MSGEPPIGQLFGQLVDDGKRYAQAELQLAKAKAARKVLPLRPAAILAGTAATLLLSATTALLVGLILALTPRLGALGATAVVVLGAFLIAGILFYVAWRFLQEVGR